MFTYLIALAIAGAMSVPATAQAVSATPNAPSTSQAQPQMVKKTICEENDNPSTTIHRICHTVMVPAQPSGSASNKSSATNLQPGSGN